MEKNSVASGFLWRLLERVGALGAGFIVSIVIARVVNPVEFGIVAIAQVFVSFFSIIVEGGFSNALIQKQDADDLDFSTVFYFNILVCLALYALVYFMAPIISSLYQNPIFTPLLRVQGVVLIIGSVKGVQVAYVSRAMQFKRFFFSTLGGVIGSATVGIWMAYNGYGVWALAFQSITSIFLDVLILWFTVKWRPKKDFSYERLRKLFSYGSKLMVGNILYSVYEDLRQLIIGKFYSSADLAFYNRASLFSSATNSLVSKSLNSVLFSVMSSEQDDKEKISTRIKFVNQIFSFVMFPCMVGLCVCADSLIKTLFTEKWYATIPYLKILSFTYLLDGIGISNLNAIRAIGRSDISLRIDIQKTIVYILLLLIAIPFGVKAVAVSFVISVYIAELLIAYHGKELFGYPLTTQLKDLRVIFVLALFMGVCIYPIRFISLPSAVLLLLQIVVGFCIYVIGAGILKLEQFYYLVQRVQALLKR